MNKLLKKLGQAIAISLFLVLAAPLTIGFYLAPKDNIEKTDIIVVVSGGETEARVKEGVNLYKDGYAPKILFSGAAREGDVSNALAMKRIAMRGGVPEKDILIEENSRDTEENAVESARIIREAGYKKIILTTSPYHQRRAYRNFSTALPKDTVILNAPAKDSIWRKYGWWRNPDSINLTFSEIIKNIYTASSN